MHQHLAASTRKIIHRGLGYTVNDIRDRLQLGGVLIMADPTPSASSIARREDCEQSKEGVDPEVAAAVIRDYLLPLFEEGNRPVHDAKCRDFDARGNGEISGRSRDLNTEPAVGCGVPLPAQARLAMVVDGAENGLLSTRLLEEITRARDAITALQSRLETTEFERSGVEERYLAVRQRLHDARRELKSAEYSLNTYRARSTELEMETQSLRAQIEELSEEMRRSASANGSLSTELYNAERKIERLSRELSEQKNLTDIAKLESEVLTKQVRALHEATQELGGMKKCQDRLRRAQEVAAITEFKDQLEIETARVVEERDGLLGRVEDLTSARDGLASDKARLQAELDEQASRRAQIIDLFEEMNAIRKERDKMEKRMKDLQEDRDKLKQRLKKYYARRRLFELDQRTCKNCNKEYMESGNFNWSCRTHQSEFGGELWWCCGKPGKDATGCKFAKHESKDEDEYDDLLDDDDDDENGDTKDEAGKKKKNNKSLQNVKCYSCKEMGHAAESCPRDPNVRSLRKGFQVAKELRRLEILQTAAMAGGRRTRATIGPGDETGPSASGEMGNTINRHLRYEAVEVMASAGDPAIDFSDISSGLAEKSAEREAILGLIDPPDGAGNEIINSSRPAPASRKSTWRMVDSGEPLRLSGELQDVLMEGESEESDDSDDYGILVDDRDRPVVSNI
ncbi:hypothetical protein FOZ63_001837 [Perkinsus olseni]|uniref:CCHC-type domain-containing protein n=1 Tax=Perkinsus olseni TaxID=32597 RepID=A0A7J6S8S1_PEROL|nr:hypothetical protein FOZ62_016358 [Perkinsus olseni]KAF4729318.1 hypothetical protein FOZ63_001837 [Perkinsus olseni]